MDAPVRHWIEGAIEGRVVSFEILLGATAMVVAASCETGTGMRDVVAKVYRPGHPWASRTVVEREAAAIRGAGAVVPTPDVIAVTWDSAGGSEVEGNGLLMGRLAGRSRLDEADLVSDVRAMAAALATIHALTPPDSPTKWPEREPKLPDRPVVPDWALHANEWTDAFDALKAELAGSAPVFLHGDFHPDNLLFDRAGTLTGVLDWSAAAVGAPELDVAQGRRSLAVLAGLDAADRFVSTYQALSGRELPNQAWFDVLASVGSRPEGWQGRHSRFTPELTARVLRPRLESFLVQRLRELRRGHHD
jgi:aminoglycoside phosphotransferase (APT) family kinase protein